MQRKESQFSELISSLSAVLDLDENVKLYHAWRTALFAYRMAQIVLPAEAEQVFFAGLLHDVGAVGLADHLVHHPEGDHESSEIIRQHPYLGAGIVKEIPGLTIAAELIRDHHETIDGEGYPAKKRGEEISVGSQILYIADHLDLLLRNPLPDRTDIYNAFRVKKGRKFNRSLWPVFLDIFHSNGGTYLHILRENHGLYQLMQETLSQVSSVNLHLPDNFLDQAVTIFGKIIDAKHSYTHGHTDRVVQYSTIIGQAYGYTPEEIQRLRRAVYLHDVGKLGVPLRILDKKEPLNDEEFYKIRRHIIITMEVLDSMSFLRDLTEISGYHHARWDGKGYPDRIQGEAIPLGARMICIGDSFDAMTSNRAYRKAFDFERAWNELQQNGGTQFDPNLTTLLGQPGVRDRFYQVYQSQFAEKK